MARIQTETQQDIQAPSVSLAPVSVQPSPLAEFAQRIGPTVYAIAEAKAENKFKQKVQTTSSGILRQMNSRIDEVIPNIGQDLTPTQAQAGLQGELNDLLANSGLDPKQWSAIRTQVESRINTLGKQHYVEVDGQKGVIDNVTNEWRPIVPAGADEKEELLIQHASQIDPFTWAAIQETATTKGIEAANQLIIDIGRVNIRKKYLTVERQEVGYSREQLGLQRDIRELNAPRNQAQFITQFNGETLTNLGNAFINAVRNGADSESMKAAFRKEVTNSLLESEDILADAGTNSAEVNERIEPVVSAYENYMTAVSSREVDKRRLDTLKTDIALKVAAAKNALPPDELALYENAGKLESLSRTALAMGVFEEQLGETFPNLMQQLDGGKLQEVVLVDQVLSPAWRQNAEPILAVEDDVDGYQRLVNDSLRQFNIVLNDGTGRVRMNYDTMLWTVERLKSHPLYEELRRDVPEVAAILEEQEQALRQLGE